MRLVDITGKDLIDPDLGAALRTDALRALVELLGRQRGYTALQKEEYLAEVLKRHSRVPSGLGRGLAFPNARIANLGQPALAVGLSRKGLDFQARDGKPAHVVLLYLGRAKPPEEERRMLWRLSEALSDPKPAETLVAASTVDDVWKALAAIDAPEKIGAH